LIEERCINKSVNNIVIYKNKFTALNIGLSLAHFDYEKQYKYRNDTKRRVSILIFTNFTLAREFFDQLTISGKYLFDRCVDKQQFFIGNNSMNDPYNAQSYWIDLYYKRYGESLVKKPEVRYVNYFPVSFGINGTEMTRDYFGRNDSQQPVYYISHNKNIFSENYLPKFDYIVVDCTYMTDYIPNIPQNIKTVFCYNSILDNKIIYYSNKKAELIWFDDKIDKKLASEIHNYNTILENLEKFKIINIKPEFEAELKTIAQFVSNHNIRHENEGLYKCVSKFYYMSLACTVKTIDFDEVVAKVPYKQTFTDLINEMQEKYDIYEVKYLNK